MRIHRIPHTLIPYHIIPDHVMPWHILPYSIIYYPTLRNHHIPYAIIPYCTIPYHILPYHIILNCTIPHQTTTYYINTCSYQTNDLNTYDQIPLRFNIFAWIFKFPLKRANFRDVQNSGNVISCPCSCKNRRSTRNAGLFDGVKPVRLDRTRCMRATTTSQLHM